MSLGIVIKGPEGVVLAADSRVILFNQTPNPQVQGQTLVIPVNYDNATKLLRANGQNFVGAVTYGLGAMMTPQGPRTMQSFIPEFEEFLKKKNVGRLLTKDFSAMLSDFFVGRWNAHMNRPPQQGEEINFIVGGYDKDDIYGHVFTFVIPTNPKPVEQNAGPGQFGITWGGQADLVYRLLFGFDVTLPQFLASELHLGTPQINDLSQKMVTHLQAGIPYQVLPLQDCVNLAVFLLKSTIDFLKFRMVLRAVGGPVEVATITGVEGFKFVAQKRIEAV
jgi:hypothetical protein